LARLLRHQNLKAVIIGKVLMTRGKIYTGKITHVIKVPPVTTVTI